MSDESTGLEGQSVTVDIGPYQGEKAVVVDSDPLDMDFSVMLTDPKWGDKVLKVGLGDFHVRAPVSKLLKRQILMENPLFRDDYNNYRRIRKSLDKEAKWIAHRYARSDKEAERILDNLSDLFEIEL